MKTISFFLVMCLSACASFDGLLQKPTVELAALDVRDPSLTAATLVFGIRVDNPNSFSIPIGKLRYDLDLNAQDFAAGTIDSPGSVPARGATTIDIPVRIPYTSLFRTIKAGIDSKKLNYRIQGEVTARGYPIPFNTAGDVALPSDFPSPRS